MFFTLEKEKWLKGILIISYLDFWINQTFWLSAFFSFQFGWLTPVHDVTEARTAQCISTQSNIHRDSVRSCLCCIVMSSCTDKLKAFLCSCAEFIHLLTLWANVTVLLDYPQYTVHPSKPYIQLWFSPTQEQQWRPWEDILSAANEFWLPQDVLQLTASQ